jgi:hypothetical protein
MNRLNVMTALAFYFLFKLIGQVTILIFTIIFDVAKSMEESSRPTIQRHIRRFLDDQRTKLRR